MIGPIIPPSIIMVIYATEANISVGNMFKAVYCRVSGRISPYGHGGVMVARRAHAAARQILIA